MLQAFKNFIKKDDLFHSDDKVLTTVSGGMDSVVMADLFHKAQITFGIAHCNFQLRGEESDGDEDFVRDLAKQWQVSFYTKRFFTTDYADLHGLSTQMAARELRYNWFEEIRSADKYDYIATAHHLDDQVETFFINLMRSTGIAGLHGILPKQGRIIHPMLFTTRQEIESYVFKHKIPYREDSSNQEDKYLRNNIRHQIAPAFNTILPGFSQVLNENITRIREAEMVFRKTIEDTRKTIVSLDGTTVNLSIKGLRALYPLNTYLYEFLSPYGFNFSVVEDIAKAVDQEPGKQFFSPTHRLIKDREFLIITTITNEDDNRNNQTEYSIHDGIDSITDPIPLSFSINVLSADYKMDPLSSVANLDMNKVHFPLTLRKWQKGDSFHPFGLNGRKKISDFFIDQKFSIADKENCWLLWSGDKIIWVVGHRIDNRFRITSKTRKVLQIRLGR
jgi:tRNA(Ile)-lysidine synthase